MVNSIARGKTMRLRRVLDSGDIYEAEINAQDLGLVHGITFKVDAEVEEGDEITDTLPNGKERVMRIHDIEVHQNPFGGRGALDHTGAKYTVVNPKAVLRQPAPVTLPGLHPLVSRVSGSHIATNHHDTAVFEALKIVEDRVKTLSGRSDIGKRLMTAVFNEQAPLLDVTSDNADADQQDDEREGFKFLFMGAAQALRNTRGHGPSLQTDPQEAMEMLATASLLMRVLDRAEKRLGGRQE